VRAELDVRVRASFSTDDGEYHEIGGFYREVTPGRGWSSLGLASDPGAGIAGDGVAQAGR
jgi:hypothetical protein